MPQLENEIRSFNHIRYVADVNQITLLPPDAWMRRLNHG